MSNTLDPNTTLLVLGTSRGGTTLITAALGAHPAVAMLDEEFGDAVFHVTGGKFRGNKLCVPNQLEWDKHHQWWHELFAFSGYLRKSMLYNLMPCGSLSMTDYLKRSPVQPICILRNPDSVISSIVKRERRKTKVAAYRWSRCVNFFQQLLDEHPKQENLKKPIIINFEKLVASPEATLKKLCLEIGLEYHPQMLEAPERNTRYGGKTFDASKAADSISDKYASFLSDKTLTLYESLIAASIPAETDNNPVKACP
ncbi:Uncharacterised protein [Zhongshania aliphaticivorans]|uniref:Sulfotransferase family protein n=1 Tax=Zhongshania aliphaticivorans TaxID=1470434 RepID=A0A5S9Q305_9GAMM|nr:sulfotransferase [Zhongshania aliphaticivorans]CAA0111609.1 Uncharacterised protein [Zhongshania aliphaticivorans]CAA0118722.1 Uncharacterised protein [Zhongshania aliphaticivorans]